MLEIIKRIKSGELSRETDESGANGFWDLAGDCLSVECYEEEAQEAIYYALWELYETMEGLK